MPGNAKEKAYDLLRPSAESLGLEARVRDYPPGSAIFRQGFAAGGVHFIESGLAKSSVLAENGTEVLVAMLGPGATLGDLEYFLGSDAVCTVAAVDAVRTRFFPVQALDRMAEADGRLLRVLGRIQAGRLKDNADRFVRSLAYPLDYNVLVCVSTRWGLDGRAMRKAELLEYLGVSPRHLNRVLLGLSREGLVRIEGGSVAAADAAAIARRLSSAEDRNGGRGPAE